MGYKYSIVFHFVGTFSDIKDYRAFTDDFRVFLENYKIDGYEVKASQEDNNISTETWFKNSLNNIQDLRAFLDIIRKFLKEKNIHKYDYHLKAEYVKAGL